MRIRRTELLSRLRDCQSINRFFLKLFSRSVVCRSQNTARYEWDGMPCLYTLTVDWTAAEGALTLISGGYGSGCL